MSAPSSLKSLFLWNWGASLSGLEKNTNLITLTISYQVHLAISYLRVSPPAHYIRMVVIENLLRLVNHNKTLQELTIKGLNYDMSLEFMDVLYENKSLQKVTIYIKSEFHQVAISKKVARDSRIIVKFFSF